MTIPAHNYPVTYNEHPDVPAPELNPGNERKGNTMATASTEHITLTAPDISCGHCVATVQSALGAQDGVQSVTANADTKQVEVDFDTAKISVEQISKALDEAGYPVAG
jgi:copper ion binding protein